MRSPPCACLRLVKPGGFCQDGPLILRLRFRGKQLHRGSLLKVTLALVFPPFLMDTSSSCFERLTVYKCCQDGEVLAFQEKVLNFATICFGIFLLPD